MCGIAGQLKLSSQVDEHTLQAMTDALRHRGPDNGGIYTNAAKCVGLGHRRLALLDLSEAGHQPMSNEDGTIWIVHNGEVYNYLELKQILEGRGHVFRSKSDSEVILHAFEEWRYDAFSHIKGMFAFAIWDERKGELILARDRFGIKPLYYSFDDCSRCFSFASEIKAIKTSEEVKLSLDPTAFADFFVYRCVPSPKSIWKEVRKLPPAHFLTIDRLGAMRISRYWKLASGNATLTDAGAVDRFDELVAESVASHARSDVSLGVFLSGGYDSSALVSYLKRGGFLPETFSLGFRGWEHKDQHFAEIVAKHCGTKHSSLLFDREDMELLDELAFAFDEPIADLSILPAYVLSREASKRVKTVLSGEGPDELLVGYNWQMRYLNLAQGYSWLSRLRGMGTKARGAEASQPLMRYYATEASFGHFDYHELRCLLAPDLRRYLERDVYWHYEEKYERDWPEIKALQKLDLDCFLSELALTKVDRSSMAHSLEVRVPFLDHELCEFIFSLEPSVYFRRDVYKHLLYRSIKQYLPPEVLEREKQGFVAPDAYL